MFYKIHIAFRTFVLWFIDLFYPLFKKFIPHQTFRYIACGGGNTLLDFIIFVVMNDIVLNKQPLHVSNTFVPSSHNVAMAICFSICFPLGFYLSRYVVFQEAKGSKKEQLLKYIAVVAFCFVLNYGFMNFFINSLSWDAKIAKIVTTFFVVFFSYLAQKHFTFKLDDGTEIIEDIKLD